MDTTQDTPRFGYLSYAALSDVGRRRKNNEDSHGEWPEQGVFCVADGMGGARDGEVASRIVVEHLSMEVGKWNRFSPPIALDDRLALIDKTLNAASAWIFNYAETHDAKGCGTTFVGVAFNPADATKAVALHAGDSRLYRIRRKKIQLVTRDHSVANMAGVKNEAELDPAFRNMILRAVGINDTVELERTPFDVADDDWIIICSDGLSKMMDDSSISKTVREAKSEEQAVKALIDGANRLGGKDNITVVAVHVVALPVEGKVHAPLTDEELAEMQAPVPEDGESSSEAAFTIPTTVTDGGGENGQVKSGGSFFSDDEMETAETPPMDGQEQLSGVNGSDAETVELAVGGDASEEPAEHEAEKVEEADSPAAEAKKPKSPEEAPESAKVPSPPQVPQKVAKASPAVSIALPKAAKAPPAKTEPAIREIGGRGTTSFAKWAIIAVAVLAVSLGAWISLARSAQSPNKAQSRDAKLSRFAAIAEEAAGELERKHTEFVNGTASAEEASDAIATGREKLSNAAGFVTGVPQAEIAKRRNTFDEAAKRLEEAVVASREAREKEIAEARAKAEAVERAKAGEANLADAAAKLREKAHKDWLAGIPEAGSNELARIEDNAYGWIEDARKDAIGQAGEAGVGADAMEKAKGEFDSIAQTVKDAVGKRRDKLAQMAIEEEAHKREIAEKARAEAEAKARAEAEAKARAAAEAKARAEAEAKARAEAEAKARAEAEAKARAEAKAEAEAKAKAEAEAEAKRKEAEKADHLAELEGVLRSKKGQIGSPAARLSKRRYNFEVEKMSTEDKNYPAYYGKLLEVVLEHGDSFAATAEYPVEFAKELSDFKWALDYLLKNEVNNDAGKKLQKWQNAIEKALDSE